MLSWLRRRHEAERLARHDPQAVICDHGADANGGARPREQRETRADRRRRRPAGGALTKEGK